MVWPLSCQAVLALQWSVAEDETHLGLTGIVQISTWLPGTNARMGLRSVSVQRHGMQVGSRHEQARKAACPLTHTLSNGTDPNTYSRPRTRPQKPDDDVIPFEISEPALAGRSTWS